MTDSGARTAFIRAQTVLRQVAHVPEISLHVADEAVHLWQMTEDELGAIGLPPPYWAFASAGGHAPPGSGLVSSAAAKAGAAPVVANDIDAYAESAIALNAEANGVHIEMLLEDLL